MEKRKMLKIALALLTVSVVIAGLICYANAGTKTLEFGWNQEMSADFAGWKLYKSTAPNVAVSAANLFATIAYAGTPAQAYTSNQVLTSPDGQSITYYFVLTAFDKSGNESAKSNEVSAMIDFQGPGVPLQLRVTVSTP